MFTWHGECSDGTAVTATAPRTAKNDTALAPNTTAALVAARSAPPTAGPIARAKFWLTDPNAIAWGRSAGGTNSGDRVCQVGALAAPPTPMMNKSASSTAGVIAERAASAASAAAATSITTCDTRMRRRRSTRSPSAPPGIATSKTGRLPAAEIALSSSADVVNDVITHCAATVCIHDPTLLVNCAVHSRRKAAWRSGAHALESGAVSGTGVVAGGSTGGLDSAIARSLRGPVNASVVVGSHATCAQTNRRMKARAISATSRQPWSMVRACPRSGTSTISVTASLRDCSL